MSPKRLLVILFVFITVFTGLHYVKPLERYFPSAEEFIPDYIIDHFSRNKCDTVLNYIHTEVDTLLNDISVDTNNINEPVRVNIIHDSVFKSNRQVRIMYYGDSQIEGDRFSSYMRSVLQHRFSGSGTGLFLPVMPVVYTKSMQIDASPNWKRYNYISYRNGEIYNTDFGAMLAVCRYIPENSVSEDTVTATVTVSPSIYADNMSSRYELIRVFYKNRDGAIRFSVKADEQSMMSTVIDTTSTVSEIVCPVNYAKSITVEFKGNVSPDILGISIEGSTGVVVDNIPQRGSAGLEFTMIERKSMPAMYDMLKPDIFILQYGLNVATNIRNEYSNYQRGIERQIKLLNDIAPDAAVVVVGVTDIAHDSAGIIKSYSNIPAIINAQRNAAAATDAIFFNMFSAMGGDSSIIRWTHSNPPLAAKDYTHLTGAGADTLAMMMVNNLFSYSDTASTGLSIPCLKTIHDYDEIADQVRNDDYSDIASEEYIEHSIINRIIRSIFSYDSSRPVIFTTAIFWLFILFVFAGYCIVFNRKTLRSLYLLIISLFFYYKSGGLFFILLILVTAVDYVCSILIHRSKVKAWRRVFLCISIVSNLLILAWFKYAGFITDGVNAVLGSDFKTFSILGTGFNVDNIVLPVGISFFTFQALSYTIDVYRRKVEPVRNIIDFGFFVSFFPQLVAGPIVRASEFIPQLYADFSLSRREYGHAVFIILKGLVKKIIISDFIAVNLIDRVFDMPHLYSGFENMMAVYGYGLQIYCDFSGYTDIAIGVGLLFGFRFPVNFNSPYKAHSIADFWKRWHISLSRWLKDYLYIPLGGNRRGLLCTCINLLLTMLIGGLWHGASVMFIIWGGLHGMALVVARLWRRFAGGVFAGNAVARVVGAFVTFNFVMLCWMFFRSPDIAGVSVMLGRIFTDFGAAAMPDVVAAYLPVFALIAAGYFIHLVPERVKEAYRGAFINAPPVLQFAVVLAVASLLYQMRSAEVMPFIYFRF